jgi:hypothetical protein
MDELKHFRRRLPSPDLRPRRSGALPPDATDDEKRTFDAVDGRRTLIDLGIATRLGEFIATKAVHRLLDAGAVAVDAPTHERTPGPNELDSSVTIAGYDEVLSEIYAAVGAAGLDAPYRISVDAFLLSEAKLNANLFGLSLEPDGTLPEEKLLRPYQKGGDAPEKAVQLRKFLDAVVGFALFQASEILDPKSASDLETKARMLLKSDR